MASFGGATMTRNEHESRQYLNKHIYVYMYVIQHFELTQQSWLHFSSLSQIGSLIDINTCTIQRYYGYTNKLSDTRTQRSGDVRACRQLDERKERTDGREQGQTDRHIDMQHDRSLSITTCLQQNHIQVEEVLIWYLVNHYRCTTK